MVGCSWSIDAIIGGGFYRQLIDSVEGGCHTGELVACVDADTMVLEDCLNEMVKQFDGEKVGAVISTIKVTQPKNIYEKLGVSNRTEALDKILAKGV